MAASTEGTQASSRPMSRVARKLAESSQEIPATAGLSLPALRGDAVVPPTKALPVVTRDEERHQAGEETSMRTTRDTRTRSWFSAPLVIESIDDPP